MGKSLNSPTKLVFIISVCLIVAGLVVKFVTATGSTPLFSVGEIGFWVTFVGGGLLSLSCLLKGL